MTTLPKEIQEEIEREFDHRMHIDCPSMEAFFPGGGDSYDFQEGTCKKFIFTIATKSYLAGQKSERERVRKRVAEINVPKHDCPHGSTPPESSEMAADQAVCWFKEYILHAISEASKEDSVK